MATYDVKQIALPGGDIANLKDGNAIHKSNTSGLVKNDGTIDTESYTDEIDAIVNVYGGKNLLCIKLSDVKQANTAYGTWNNNVWTMQNVTYTLDVDSFGYVKSITATGTAQNRSYIILPFTSFTKGRYKLNGYIGNASYQSGLSVYCASSTRSEILGYITSLDGFEFEEPQATADLLVFNFSMGETGDNETFYPMIRDARITDNAYVPYAMTNRELTEKKTSWVLLHDEVGDGVKTYGNLASAMSQWMYNNNIDLKKCILSLGESIFHSMGKYIFVSISALETSMVHLVFRQWSFHYSQPGYWEGNGTVALTDYSSSIMSSGTKLELWAITE